jgi:hypothetical protein
MAISPRDTDLLTNIEQGLLITHQDKIDDALREHWEIGQKVAYPFNPDWRDELVAEFVRLYEEAGWNVIVDKPNSRFIFSTL